MRKMKINSSCTRNELWIELYKHYAGSYGLHDEEKRCKDLRYNGKQVDYLDYGGIMVDNQYIPRKKVIFEYLSVENGEEKENE